VGDDVAPHLQTSCANATESVGANPTSGLPWATACPRAEALGEDQPHGDPPAELTADHLGRRSRFDYTNDDDTFAIARLVKIQHKHAGKSADTETETRLDVELMGNQRVTVRFNRLGVVELL
jgi:hypothetical protein